MQPFQTIHLSLQILQKHGSCEHAILATQDFKLDVSSSQSVTTNTYATNTYANYDHTCPSTQESRAAIIHASVMNNSIKTGSRNPLLIGAWKRTYANILPHSPVFEKWP